MSARFTEADLHRLEAWLLEPERGEEALMPDGLQGLLCAVASSPAPIAASSWMSAALGDDARFASTEERSRIEDLLAGFHDDVAAQLNAGEHLDMVLYGDDGTEDQDASLAEWCEGYLRGVELADPAWSDGTSEEELDEMLMPFVVLSGRAKEAAFESGEAWMDPADERRLATEARASLVDVILDNRAYWFERSIPGTVRREAPKVGRNDPCPCGSGKKYKNCCGRTA